MANLISKSGRIEDDAAVGTASWFSPSSAGQVDSRYASISFAGTSHYLKASKFGFKIPTDATITGVVASITKTNINTGSVKDSVVKLLVSNTVSGNNKADTTTNWANSTITYGTSSDLWGTVLTPSIVNADDFGLVFSALGVAGGKGACTYGIDAIILTVHYTTATNITDQFSTTGSWVCPTGVTSVTVECWGGGGGAGGGTLDSVSGHNLGGGGGGGAYSKSTLSVTAGNSYTVTVGTGGAAGVYNTTTPTDGTAGGDSWFNTSGTILAKGGGKGNKATSTTVGNGGLGALAANGIGTTKFSGGDGSNGQFRVSVLGQGGGNAGGGGAGSTANGSSASATNIGGAGGALGGGDGGMYSPGGATTGLYCSGGGASGDSSSASANGGDGRVVITYVVTSTFRASNRIPILQAVNRASRY